MAKQHCRELSPHSTDEGKASIKKYDKLGIWAEVRGEGSEWVLKAKPWAHAVRNRKRNIGMSTNISVVAMIYFKHQTAWSLWANMTEHIHSNKNE